jgi:hypothetical protein
MSLLHFGELKMHSREMQDPEQEVWLTDPKLIQETR